MSLRTAGKLFKLFVAGRCNNAAKAKQVTEALKRLVGVHMKVKSTGTGPQEQLKVSG